jgi:hypothetical protein
MKIRSLTDMTEDIETVATATKPIWYTYGYGWATRTRLVTNEEAADLLENNTFEEYDIIDSVSCLTIVVYMTDDDF